MDLGDGWGSTFRYGGSVSAGGGKPGEIGQRLGEGCRKNGALLLGRPFRVREGMGLLQKPGCEAESLSLKARSLH